MKSSKSSKHPTLQIVEGHRVDGKIKQRVVASLGVVRNSKDRNRLDKLAENFLYFLQKHGSEAAQQWLKTEQLAHSETVYNGYVLATKRLLEITGFHRVINRHESKHAFTLSRILEMIIAQYFDCPSSKRRCVMQQQNHGFNDIELHQVYRAMDVLFELNDPLQHQAFRAAHGELFEDPVDCFFFDVTTLYFESVSEDEMKSFGFSKDQKSHCVQVVYCLVVNKEGIPLAYEAYRGNTAEVSTLIEVMDKLKQRFSVDSVTVVCDRAMGSKKNLDALQKSKYHFVIGAKLRQLSPKLAINDCSQMALYKEEADDKIYIRTIDHPTIDNSQLIITYSTRRAKKDARDREKVLEKLIRALDTEDDAIKNVITNSAYKKFIKSKKGSFITLNQQAIDQDKAWDGFHGLVVSKSANLEPELALNRYRNLWRIEEAFRVTKTFLRTRPMFHRIPRRIHTHLLISFITLHLERSLEVMLRRKGTPLTPDRIRAALASMHYIEFQDSSSGQSYRMESTLSEDMVDICEVLGLDKQRVTSNSQK